MGIISDPNSLVADSYVSVAEATLILGSRPFTDAWDALGLVPNSAGFLVDGAHLTGVTTIAIKDGTGTFELGSVVQFGADPTFYSIAAEVPGVSIDIAPPLAIDVADNAVIRRRTYNEKEKILLYSTSTLDVQVDWNGSVRDQDQPLRWPRFAVHDCEAIAYCEDCFPDDLKQLTAEFGLYLSDRDLASQPGLLGLGFNRAKLDVLEVTVDKGQTLPMMPDYVIDLLGCMGVYSPTRSGGAKTMELRRT